MNEEGHENILDPFRLFVKPVRSFARVLTLSDRSRKPLSNSTGP